MFIRQSGVPTEHRSFDAYKLNCAASTKGYHIFKNRSTMSTTCSCGVGVGLLCGAPRCGSTWDEDDVGVGGGMLNLAPGRDCAVALMYSSALSMFSFGVRLLSGCHLEF